MLVTSFVGFSSSLSKANNAQKTLVYESNNTVITSVRTRDPVPLPVNSSWWDLNWSYRREITIDHTKVAGDLINFPILVETTMDVSKVQPDGDDIVFTNSQGMKLNHEIELYDGSTGELVAWVNITSLSSTSDTTLWMYYGNPTCSNQQNKYGTWDSDYIAVFHMNGASYDAITDSTANKNNVTGVVGSPTYQQTGKAGYSVQFPGTAWLTFSSPIRDSLPMTMEAWAKPTYFTSGNYFLSNGASAMDFDGGSGINYMDMDNASNNRYVHMWQGSSSAGTWYYYGMSWSGGFNDNGIFYVQSTKTSIAPQSYSPGGSEYNLCIGVDAWGASAGYWAFTGYVDEIRISKVARTDAWLRTSYNSINSSSTFVSIGEEQGGFDPFHEGWAYRKQITIDHTKIASDLTNFPVFIHLTDSDLKTKAQTNGNDILFMDNIGIAQQLNHEIESYDATTGELAAWVNIPSLSSTVDTVFYMYYGNALCGSQQNVEATWNPNFMAVWHLNNNPTGTIVDSTANHNNGTSYGGMTSSDLVDGKVGKCFEFDGIDDYISVPDSSSLKPTDLTLIAWYQPKDEKGGYFLAKQCYDYWGNSAGQTYEFGLGELEIDHITGGFEKNTYEQVDNIGNKSVTVNTWSYMALTFNKTTQEGIFYVNGVLNDVKTCDSSVLWYNNPWDFTMGGCRWGVGGEQVINSFSHCGLDEIRVLNTPLSPGWISTEFNNQNNSSSFYSIGTECHLLNANFTYTINDRTISCNALSSYDIDGNITLYSWDFGDGTNVTGIIVNHSYSQYGTYYVTLTVTDDDGRQDSVTNIISVLDFILPEITDNTPSVGYTGDSFTFNATITDNDQVSIANVEYWYGAGAHSNVSMMNIAGNYWTKIITIPNNLDILYYFISAVDPANNWNSSGVKEVMIVDNIKPVIVDHSLSVAYTGDSFIFNATITDNIQVSTAQVEYWYGTGTHTTTLMTHNTGDSWITIITILNTLDVLHYIISANDTSNNWNTTRVKNVTIFDNDKPVISNIQAEPQQQIQNGCVNISATVTDNIEVNQVYLSITYPNGLTCITSTRGGIVENFSITQNKTGDTYYCNKTYRQLGTYTYHLWANDTSGNRIRSTDYTFTIIDQPPYIPHNPIPANDSVNVPINVTLTWVGGDPDPGDTITYDVYFGTSSSPPKEASNISATSYTPKEHNFNTTYHWRIVAWDNHGVNTIGPSWQYTIRTNTAPGAPLIDGPNSGKAKKSYNYTFVAVDPEDDNIFYQINWGDGNVSDWFGPFESNDIITRNHTWQEKGTYTIEARAKDVYGYIGAWGTLIVTMPLDVVSSNTLLLNKVNQSPNAFPSLRQLLIR